MGVTSDELRNELLPRSGIHSEGWSGENWYRNLILKVDAIVDTTLKKMYLKIRTCTCLFFLSNSDLKMSTGCSQFYVIIRTPKRDKNCINRERQIILIFIVINEECIQHHSFYS